MKTISGLVALAIVGTSISAFAQNAPMTGGATNPPPGTTGSNTGSTLLPESTTNTARPGALDSTSVSGAQAAAQVKFQEAGFNNVKGLSRTTDGVWTGRGVKNGVEVNIAMDSGGNITTQ
ncbi:hypothetical protein BH10PSE6_BH10PSE6_19640 [soil metagenome]